MTSSTIACVRLCSQGHIDGFHSEQRLFFDDATRLILVPRNEKIEAYDLPSSRVDVFLSKRVNYRGRF